MVKVLYLCDFCGTELSDEELFKQKFLGRSLTNEINTKNFCVCEKCAIKIDYALVKTREYILKNGCKKGAL